MAEFMGVQLAADLLTLLRQCEATEAGVMVERRDGTLGLDSHTSRENLTAALTLNYASSHIDDIAPADDDQLTANDVTVTRIGGSSGRVTQDTGPMGTDPTTGAGRYEKSASLSLYEDDQAYVAAGWMVWLGTQNGYRYPVLALKLHNSALSALVDTIAAVDISDRITIQNLPSNLPPDDVELMVEGYTERINSFEWEISFNCAPYSPYQVGVLAETSGDTDPNLGWTDYDTCELVTAVDTDDTSWSVTTIPLESDNSDDYPRQHYIGGELVTVTAAASRIYDQFARNSTDTWDTSTSGHTYTYQGTQADYDVTTAPFGHGTIQPTTTATDYTATIDCGSPDVDEIADFSLNTLPATGTMSFGLVGRGTDTSNRYMGRASIATTGLVTLELHKRVAGVSTTESQVTNLTIATGTKYRMRFKVIGDDLLVKIWLASGSEDIARRFSTTFTDLTTGNLAGVFTRNNTAVTTHVVSVDDFKISSARTWTVTRNVNGISGGKSHSSGAEITLAYPLVTTL